MADLTGDLARCAPSSMSADLAFSLAPLSPSLSPPLARLGLWTGALACALLGALGSACSRADSPSRSTSDASASSSSERPTPLHIASRTVFADELLWAMGPEVQIRVVGLSSMADDARYSTVAGVWPESTPRLGPNPESLLALSPDLVILASFNAAEYRAAIEDKLEVLVLEDFDGFDGYRRNLELVGDATHMREATDQVWARFDAGITALEAERPGAENGDGSGENTLPSVVCWDHGYVPGADTTFHDAASAAGFRNLPALPEAGGLSGHERVDTEQLVAWDPNWLVIGCGEHSCEAAVAGLSEQAGIRQMTAVTEGRVIAVPAPYLGTTGEGMLELATRLQAPLLE